MHPLTIDAHVHFGAPQDEESGCYWSKAFTKTPAYFAMRLLTRSFLKKVTFAQIHCQIMNAIHGSRQVDKTVLLAMDQVYDQAGNVRRDQTHLHTPNRYIARLAREDDRVLFGASIHPYRPDWQDELDFCLRNGAVLCKWIPSAQLINPADDRCIPFYDQLAEYRLPLLCHCGPEYAIPTSDKNYNEFNNPKYLRNALNRGVVVIIAHCALPYFADLDVPYLEHYHEFLQLFAEAEQKDWRLYADLSAVTGPLRKKYMPEIEARIPAGRLIYGSDFPVPISEFSYHSRMHPVAWLRFLVQLLRIKNPLDKNYAIIQSMGFDPGIFTNAASLFMQIVRPT